MNIYSDPVIQLCDPPLVCSVCGEHSHTKASCHHVRAEEFANLSHEDIVFWSYIDPCDRPEALNDNDDQDHHLIQDHESEPMEEDGDRHGEEQAMSDSEQEGFDSDTEFSNDEDSDSSVSSEEAEFVDEYMY